MQYTMYGYIVNGDIIAPVSMISSFNGVANWQILSDEERLAHAWYPCEIEEPSFDPVSQDRYGPELSLQDNKILARYIVVDKPPTEVARVLIGSVSEYRYMQEVGGVLIDGKKYPTARSDISSLMLLVEASSDVLYWKTTLGWILIGRDEVDHIASCLINHIQSCFYAEYSVCKEVEELTNISELRSYSVAQRFREIYGEQNDKCS